ncbi:centrosomal protein 15 isoform X1 [Scyliorhinus torazame]|uniref:centrosomal protein 15 isoform X1 n=2 Tax=Scyliorhinus torazame TaxID=75743 RepID=UPI003B5BB1D0
MHQLFLATTFKSPGCRPSIPGLGLRTMLLQQMENQLERQINEKNLQAVEFESANERNESILKDLEVAEDKLKVGARTHLHPTVLTLKMKYWASVEEHLPKWEQFLLGQTKSPIEVMNPWHKEAQKQELFIKSSSLPSSASNFKMPPQSPHSEKQKGTKAYKKRIT